MTMIFYNKCHFIKRQNSITFREVKISFGFLHITHMSSSAPYSQGKVFLIICLEWSTPFNNNSVTFLGLRPMMSLKKQD